MQLKLLADIQGTSIKRSRNNQDNCIYEMQHPMFVVFAVYVVEITL